MSDSQPSPKHAPRTPDRDGPLRRIGRQFRWLWLTLGTLAMVFIVVWFLVLPQMTHQRVAEQLARFGFSDASFEIVKLGSYSAMIRRLQLDEDLSIDHVHVTYAPETLIHRRVKTLRISGLALTFDWRDGSADLGPLQGLIDTLNQSQQDQADRDASDSAWPLQRVIFDDLQVTLVQPERTVRMNVRGEVRLDVQPMTLNLSGWAWSDELGHTQIESLDATVVRDAEAGWLVASLNLRGTLRSRIEALSGPIDYALALERADSGQTSSAWVDHKLALELRQGAQHWTSDGRMRLKRDAQWALSYTGDASMRWAEAEKPAITARAEAQLQAAKLSQITGSASLHLTQPITIDYPQASVTISEAEIEAQISSGVVEAQLNSRMKKLTAGPVSMATTTLDGSLRIDLADPSTLAGTLEISPESAAVRDTKLNALPPMQIDYRYEDARLVLRSQPAWLNSAQPASMTATLDRRGVMQLDVELDQPLTAIEPDTPLSHMLETLGVTWHRGDLALQGHAHWQPGMDQPHGKLTVRLNEADLDYLTEDLSLEGVTGEITIDDFQDFATPPSQQIQFAHASLAELPLHEGRIHFNAAAVSPRITIESAQMKVKNSGPIMLSHATYRPGMDAMRLNLFGRNIELADWLALLTFDHATGEGALLGWASLEVAFTPRLTVHAVAGQFHALEPGSFTIRQEQAARDFLQRTLGAIEQGDYGQVVRQRITGALRDFSYDRLNIKIMHDPKGVQEPSLWRLAINGRGKNVDQELIINMNITGMDDVLTQVMRIQMGYNRLLDAFDRRFSP